MAKSILLLLLCVPALSFAQPSVPFASSRGSFMALSVADLDASATWYVDTFALRIVKQHSRSPAGDSEATILEGRGLIVELIRHDAAKPLRQAAPSASRVYEIHGIFKTGLIVDDLDATLAELRRRSVDIAFATFKDEALGYRTFAVRDNAGNFIQFFGN
jgi:catechol 2,3-dioxygenase-like lactoylglutathione lyase family enzyme